jgi:hypothetical protein
MAHCVAAIALLEQSTRTKACCTPARERSLLARNALRRAANCLLTSNALCEAKQVASCHVTAERALET